MAETKPASADQRDLLRALRLLKRRRRAIDTLAHASEGLFYALILNLAVGVLGQLNMLPAVVNPAALFWLIPLASIVLCASIALLKKRDDLRILIDADRRLRLKERLSTALEIERKGETSRLSFLVLEDAAGRAKDVVTKRVYPLSLPPKSKWLPFLLALVVLAVFVDFENILLPIPADGLESAVVEEGRTIEEMGKRLAERAQKERLPETLKMGREMQRLGERMQNERLSIDESRDTLVDLAERTRGRREKILKTSREPFRESVEPLDFAPGAKTGDPSDVEMPGSPGMHEDAGSDGKTDSESTEPLDKEEDDDARGEEPSRGAGSGPVEEDMRGLAEAEELLREAADQLLESSEGAALAEGAAGSERGGQEGPNGEPVDEEGAKEGGTAFGGSPGIRAVEDVPGLDQERRISSEPEDIVVEVPGTGEESLRMLIRALPPEAGSDNSEQRRIQEYERQVEEAILKEEVPPAMKEFIRDYFLNIGVTRR